MNDNQRYFVEEFAEDFREGRMSRRDMLRRELLITGSTAATASALLALGCGSNAAQPKATSGSSQAPSSAGSAGTAASANAAASAAAAPGAATMPPSAQSNDLVVQTTDAAIRAERVQYSGPAGTVFGYLARPKAGNALPGIILVPENRGLVEPNMDIARRYAKEGFATLAVDLVSREGGTDKYADDPAQIPAILGRIPQPDLVADLLASLAYLKAADGVRKDRFGVTGFCFGGSQTFALAIASPEIRAAAPFYGTAKPEDVGKSQAAFINFYGETDARVTSTAEPVQAALKQAGRTVEVHIEPGAAHSFFNNTGQAYSPSAARDAWPRALAWFDKYLRTA
jgi:carboxymethylenebutenolidase